LRRGAPGTAEPSHIQRGNLARLRHRLEQLGHAAVEPENPYWLDRSVKFEDPDGWRVVLCHTIGI